jgi:hypothetical protein
MKRSRNLKPTNHYKPFQKFLSRKSLRRNKKNRERKRLALAWFCLEE